jgi:hypothetical protein
MDPVIRNFGATKSNIAVVQFYRKDYVLLRDFVAKFPDFATKAQNHKGSRLILKAQFFSRLEESEFSHQLVSQLFIAWAGSTYRPPA